MDIDTTRPSLTLALREARTCRVCSTHLPLGPKPVLQLAVGARLLIIGQAPGSKAHQSGMPWNDASGDRLRDWLALDSSVFHDAAKVAILPMGFCYPGAADGGGDMPPRPECAPLWQSRLTGYLPADRLTLLVGQYAQRHYLGPARKGTLTETVWAFAEYGPRYFPLPHPSWRSAIWMRKHPWFEATVIPQLRTAVRQFVQATAIHACGEPRL